MGVDSNMVFDSLSKTVKIRNKNNLEGYDGNYLINKTSERIKNGHKFYKKNYNDRPSVVEWSSISECSKELKTGVYNLISKLIPSSEMDNAYM